MTTVATSTVATASSYSNQRKLDRTQTNDVLWAFRHDGVNGIKSDYSTDDGATWNVGTTLGQGGSSYTGDFSVFIDLDDYLHVVYKHGNSGAIEYQRGTPNAGRTSWSFSGGFIIESLTRFDMPDVVAHREGTGWKAHVVYTPTDTSQQSTYYRPVTISSTGTITVAASATQLNTNTPTNSTTPSHPSIDFNHTGDGKTVAGSTPHLYVVWSNGSSTGTGWGIRFKKATYSAGSWTWGTERAIDSASYAYSGGVCSAFDGTRCVMAYVDSGATSTIKVQERDSGDTTTTTRTPTALSDGAVEALSVTYDGQEDIHLWAVGTTSDDVKRIKYDRSAGTWDGSWTTVAAADAQADSVSLKRGYSSTRVEALYTTGTVSPYNVVHESVALNNAPTAATWDLTNNQAHDVAAALTLDWTFNDPDPGDTQSKYALRRQIGAGSLEYYNAGTSTWGASEVENTSATTAVTLASSWGADSDANHKYAVKTWDAAGLEGSYSSELTVIPSAKDNPSISSPADLGTVTSPTITVEWSAITQTAYKARLLTSGGAEVESSGWVTSTSTSHTFDFSASNSTDYQVEVSTKNDEGLASDADTHTFSVSFTPPATPTLVATGSAVDGNITIAITNPGLGATESSNDVYVRVAAGGRPDLDTPVGGDGRLEASGVAVNGSHIFYPASVKAYEFLVRAVADTGATADSAWT